MGPVCEQATAPETLADQVGVGGAVDQMAGRRHLRARLAAAEVTAGIGGGGIELQRLQRQFSRVGHVSARMGIVGRASIGRPGRCPGRLSLGEKRFPQRKNRIDREVA